MKRTSQLIKLAWPVLVGREIHQSVWISLALIAILLLRFPDPLIAISHLQPVLNAVSKPAQG